MKSRKPIRVHRIDLDSTALIRSDGFFFFCYWRYKPVHRGPCHIHRLSVLSAISITIGQTKHVRVRLKLMFCQINCVRLFRLKHSRNNFYRSQNGWLCARHGYRLVLFGKTFPGYIIVVSNKFNIVVRNIHLRPYYTDNITTRKKKTRTSVRGPNYSVSTTRADLGLDSLSLVAWTQFNNLVCYLFFRRSR